MGLDMFFTRPRGCNLLSHENWYLVELNQPGEDEHMRLRQTSGTFSSPMRLLPLVSFLLCCAVLPSAAGQSCGSQGVAVQVLGSGGPELQDKRASSSYLVWENGQARALIDAGGGSALRFGESGATMSQLDVVLFSHYHIDHSGDFPTLIFSSWFED